MARLGVYIDIYIWLSVVVLFADASSVGCRADNSNGVDRDVVYG